MTPTLNAPANGPRCAHGALLIEDCYPCFDAARASGERIAARRRHPLESWGYIGAPQTEAGRATFLDIVRQRLTNQAASRRHHLLHTAYRPCPEGDDCREAIASVRALGAGLA